MNGLELYAIERLQDLVIDFVPHGIWKWMNNKDWGKLHDLPARSITAADVDSNGQE